VNGCHKRTLDPDALWLHAHHGASCNQRKKQLDGCTSHHTTTWRSVAIGKASKASQGPSSQLPGLHLPQQHATPNCPEPCDHPHNQHMHCRHGRWRSQPLRPTQSANRGSQQRQAEAASPAGLTLPPDCRQAATPGWQGRLRRCSGGRGMVSGQGPAGAGQHSGWLLRGRAAGGGCCVKLQGGILHRCMHPIRPSRASTPRSIAAAPSPWQE
jgi:hypothetical protein